MWPFKKMICCQHHLKENKFYDLHRGGDGELYVRSQSLCRECGASWYTAVQLPKKISDVLDEAFDQGKITWREVVDGKMEFRRTH